MSEMAGPDSWGQCSESADSGVVMRSRRSHCWVGRWSGAWTGDGNGVILPDGDEREVAKICGEKARASKAFGWMTVEDEDWESRFGPEVK